MHQPSHALRQATEHLAQAIRFETVSRSNYDTIDQTTFVAFQDWLAASYPLCHARLVPRRFGPWGVCFRWTADKPGEAAMILLAHYDVVPAGPAGAWQHPPFGGVVADGFIWGRGSLDVKISLVAIMESVEAALAAGQVPQRDIWICFGGDEEIGGCRGAGAIAASLAEQGVKAGLLVDEGGIIAQGSLSFVKAPVALVGVAEKGFANLRVSAPGSGGHASMPPAHGAAGVLAKALVRLERHPFPLRLSATMADFLRHAAPHAPPLLGFFLARPRLFWPLLRLVLAADPKTAAMIRTTQAITMLAASDKENVLPTQASAIINVRILPGESLASVLAHYRRVLKGTGSQVEVADHHHVNEPLPEAATRGWAWEAVLDALQQAEPEAIPLPYLVTAGTDTRHYLAVARAIYRIEPVMLEPADLDLIHAPNERISIANLERCLRFYHSLIRS